MIDAISFLLMAAPTDPKDGGTIQLIIMGAIVLVFWFFMIRPQTQKAKEQKKFIDELQKGAKVVTQSGIHGTINKVNEDGTFMIEIATGTYVKMDKSAINQDLTVAAYKANTTPTVVSKS